MEALPPEPAAVGAPVGRHGAAILRGIFRDHPLGVFYFEIAVLMALMGFVGSISMAKFLLRGEVIE